MSTGPISELVVPYDPGPLTEKVVRRRRLVRTRLVSLGITVAVLLLIYLWRRDDMQDAVFCRPVRHRAWRFADVARR